MVYLCHWTGILANLIRYWRWPAALLFGIARPSCQKSNPLRVTRSAFTLRNYCGSKVSEKRLVKIRCYLVFSRVKLPIQTPQCFSCYTRKTNLWQTASIQLHYENYTDSDTFHLSHTSSYLLYIFVYLIHLVYLIYFVYFVYISRTINLYIHLFPIVIF